MTSLPVFLRWYDLVILFSTFYKIKVRLGVLSKKNCKEKVFGKKKCIDSATLRPLQQLQLAAPVSYTWDVEHSV
jgi:hypothetical protein